MSYRQQSEENWWDVHAESPGMHSGALAPAWWLLGAKMLACYVHLLELVQMPSSHGCDAQQPQRRSSISYLSRSTGGHVLAARCSKSPVPYAWDLAREHWWGAP